jgi:hypothetical protein
MVGAGQAVVEQHRVQPLLEGGALIDQGLAQPHQHPQHPAGAPVGSTPAAGGLVPAAPAAAGHRSGRSWPAAWGPAGPRSRPARPGRPATRGPGVPRPRTASPCTPPPRTPQGGLAAAPATGPALPGRRRDLASLGLAGGPVDPVKGDLPPMHVQASYDAHRDLLRAPPMWLQHHHPCLSRRRSLHIASLAGLRPAPPTAAIPCLTWLPPSVASVLTVPFARPTLDVSRLDAIVVR